MNQRNTQCQNITELTNSILEEWWLFLQYMIHFLFHRMNVEPWRKRGGYTHYWVNVRDKLLHIFIKKLYKQTMFTPRVTADSDFSRFINIHNAVNTAKI